jgi:biofilm PGA synthesis N-glycosyltransferase PgaC
MPHTTTAAEERPRRFYVTVTTKFFVALVVAAMWAALSVAVCYPFALQAGPAVPSWAVWSLMVLVAIVPGWLLMFLALSLVQDEPPSLDLKHTFPPLSVVIPVRDDETGIADTVTSIVRQRYPGDLEVVVVDDGSTDGTRDAVRALADDGSPVRLIELARGDAADALNIGIRACSHAYVVTAESGAFLQPTALARIVGRLLGDPPNTAAIAGTVLVRNSRETFMARMQEWDYFLGIASFKRQQALYQGTLVAQRSFSLFKREAVLAVGGWPRVEGEDLVLTWALLKAGYRVGYEPTAVSFSRVPTTVAAFVSQRRLWARGVIEGVRKHGDLMASRTRLAGFLAATDALMPLLDLAFTIVLLPGIALAVTGRFWVIGPMLLCLVPPTAIVAWVMWREQSRVFDELGLKVRRNRVGWLGYLLAYQLVMAPVSVWGYAEAMGGPRPRD